VYPGRGEKHEACYTACSIDNGADSFFNAIQKVSFDGFKHRSELQIFRADALTDQVCTLFLPHHLPHQFHGFFTTDVLLS